MTDNEIIKALECCFDEAATDCSKECPLYNHRGDCCVALEHHAFDLINRQKAEIERLHSFETYRHCRAKAIKEFAERLKERATHDGAFGYVDSCDIDHITKEMVGDNNG